MDKNIGPNSNRFKEINEDIKEEKKEEEIYQEDDDERLEEDIKKEESMAKERFRTKIIKMMGVIIVVIIIIVLIGFIISLTSKKNYSYQEVEDMMKKAAEGYFSSHDNKLPSKASQKVEIDHSVLEEEKYMKPLEKYFNDRCTGKVVVQKKEGTTYSYTTYLDCGDSYKTTELYKKVLNKNKIVTEGYGLYQYNGGYVYRGSNVDNYVKFEDSDIVWRILKMNSSNEITLVQNETTINSFSWDERYNNALEDNIGINTYKNSLISTIVDKLYHNKLKDDSDSDYLYYDDEPTIFTKNIRSKLLTFRSCIGKRSSSDTSRDGTPECSETIDTKVSLLPVYDFLNASLDPNCKTTISPDCQNYNYLTYDSGYWLANGSTLDTASVYSVGNQGYVQDYYANSQQGLKLVIRVGSDVMIEKGKGTKENPYIIR